MRRIVLFLLFPLALVPESRAVGISIDAGVTPAQGRWIVRAQYRTMSRVQPDGGPGMEMRRHVTPLVLLHGLRPQWTLGVRQTFESRTMTMMGDERTSSGLGDLYLFTKYKALRINTRSHTIALAPVIGVTAPTGGSEITSDFWSLDAGGLASARRGPWGADLNVRYGLRGVAGVASGAPEPGDRWSVDLALARQIGLGHDGRTAIAPVLEFSWSRVGAARRDGADLPDSGESVLTAAPGVKVTRDDRIFEALVRIPVAQDQEGVQTEVGTLFLLGIRQMF